MITISSVQQYLNVPFEDYQKLPGLSTSFLKSEKNGIKPEFIMTDKVRVGSLVDAILTEPAKADMGSELYPYAKKIAYKIKEDFGDMIPSFLAQVSYTGYLHYGEFNLPVRGRLDYAFPKFAVIDLKVTYAKDIEALIKFMHYEEQMNLYCKFLGVTNAYLFVYCVPTGKCSVHHIDCSVHSEWWAEKIINFGSVK